MSRGVSVGIVIPITNLFSVDVPLPRNEYTTYHHTFGTMATQTTDHHEPSDEYGFVQFLDLQLESFALPAAESLVASNQKHEDPKPQQSADPERNTESEPYYSCWGFYQSNSKGELTLLCGSIFKVIDKRENG